MEDIDRISVMDGVPTRLVGVRRRAACIVEFIHKCCGCALRHDVKIKHRDGSSEMDITFDRLED